MTLSVVVDVAAATERTGAFIWAAPSEHSYSVPLARAPHTDLEEVRANVGGERAIEPLRRPHREMELARLSPAQRCDFCSLPILGVCVRRPISAPVSDRARGSLCRDSRAITPIEERTESAIAARLLASADLFVSALWASASIESGNQEGSGTQEGRATKVEVDGIEARNSIALERDWNEQDHKGASLQTPLAGWSLAPVRREINAI